MENIANKDKLVRIAKIKSKKKVEKTVKQINRYLTRRAKKGYNHIAITFDEIAIDTESELDQIMKLYEENGFQVSRSGISDKLFINWR